MNSAVSVDPSPYTCQPIPGRGLRRSGTWFRGAGPWRQNLDVQADRPGNHTRAVEGNVDRSALKPVRRVRTGRQRDRRVRLCRERPVRRRGQAPGGDDDPRSTPEYQCPCTLQLPGIRYGTGATSVREASTSSGPAASARPSPLACASEASAWAATATSCSSACRTASIADVAADDRARPVGRARLGRHAPRRRSNRIDAASRSTRCRRSRARAGPSSSTAPGRRSRAESD